MTLKVKAESPRDFHILKSGECRMAGAGKRTEIAEHFCAGDDIYIYAHGDTLSANSITRVMFGNWARRGSQAVQKRSASCIRHDV